MAKTSLHIHTLVPRVYLALAVGFLVIYYYYRAMHFSAKRGIAIACRVSVCPSVRPSVCNVGGL